MLSYCRNKWTSAYLPGKSLSLDEETAGCKARCALVTRIKNKKEGDGFQCDCVCEDGYTFTFWFRCDNLPATQLPDVSPRDTRCAWLVDQLPGAWYHLYMDNLFTSWKFGAMLAKRQCHRPTSAQVTSVAAIEAAKGTLKASVRAMPGAP